MVDSISKGENRPITALIVHPNRPRNPYARGFFSFSLWFSELTNSFSFSFLEKQTPYPEQATRLDILRKIAGDELLEIKQNLS